ncbi:MAG: hypothetical protein NWE92_07565 [Candidatus Bathyarchaeota archaeon]|nr:hypothetical protein [Candidatus Bathyarchaeota archaeon]
MVKRLAVVLFLLLLLMLLVVPRGNLAKANFCFRGPEVYVTANFANDSRIEVLHSSTQVKFNFSVRVVLELEVKSVTLDCYVDGLKKDTRNLKNSEAENYSYQFKITDLREGLHYTEVNVTIHYLLAFPTPELRDCYKDGCSGKMFFTLETPTAEPTPSPLTSSSSNFLLVICIAAIGTLVVCLTVFGFFPLKKCSALPPSQKKV